MRLAGAFGCSGALRDRSTSAVTSDCATNVMLCYARYALFLLLTPPTIPLNNCEPASSKSLVLLISLGSNHARQARWRRTQCWREDPALRLAKNPIAHGEQPRLPRTFICINDFDLQRHSLLRQSSKVCSTLSPYVRLRSVFVGFVQSHHCIKRASEVGVSLCSLTFGFEPRLTKTSVPGLLDCADRYLQTRNALLLFSSITCFPNTERKHTRWRIQTPRSRKMLQRVRLWRVTVRRKEMRRYDASRPRETTH